MGARKDLTAAPLVDLAHNPGYQLWRASNGWQRVVRRALEPIGLTHVQFLILTATDHLGSAEACVTQRHVARFAALDENMTSQVVRCMADKGLLVRSDHPEDARAHCIALTPKGLELTISARAALKPAIADFFSPLNKDAEILARMLRTISDREEAEGSHRHGPKVPHRDLCDPD